MGVSVYGREANLPLVVVEGSGPPLFGRNWLEKIQLNWAEIAKINGITTNQYSPPGLQSEVSECFQGARPVQGSKRSSPRSG